MHAVGPHGEVRGRAAVPAEVAIEGEKIGVPVLRVFVGVVGGVGRRARRVFEANGDGELRDKGVGCGVSRLVIDAPEDYRGRVVVLPNQLAQLLLRVVEEERSVRRVADERNLGPHHHALLVGERVPELRLLVVRDAYSVRAQLAYQCEVFALVRLAYRPALVETILMAADAVQV